MLKGFLSVLAGLLLAAALPLVLLNGCKKERLEMGADTLPTESLRRLNFDTVRTLPASTQRVKEGVELDFSQFSLGQLYDKVFGQVNIGVLLQLYPVGLDLKGYTAGMPIDKVELHLQPDAHFQEGKLELHVYYYESLPEEGVRDYTLEKFRTAGKLVATQDIDPTQGDITITSPELTAIGAKVLTPLVGLESNQVATALNKLPGLYFEAKMKDPLPAPGAVLKFNVASPDNKLTISYTVAGQPRHFEMGFSTYARRASRVEHDYSAATLKNLLDKPTAEQGQLAYLQGDGGTALQIDFEDFYQHYASIEGLAILRGELRIPVASENAPYSQTGVSALLAHMWDGISLSLLPDIKLSEAIYDGALYRKGNYYSLNITRYLQTLMADSHCPHQLRLFTVSDNVGLERLVAGVNGNSKGSVELILTYSQL